MSDDFITRLDPGGGPVNQDGFYMPVTEDGKQHPDKQVLVKGGESTPDEPKLIDGKKVTGWIMVH